RYDELIVGPYGAWNRGARLERVRPDPHSIPRKAVEHRFGQDAVKPAGASDLGNRAAHSFDLREPLAAFGAPEDALLDPLGLVAIEIAGPVVDEIDQYMSAAAALVHHRGCSE